MTSVIITVYIIGLAAAFCDGWKAEQAVLWPLEIVRRWWRS